MTKNQYLSIGLFVAIIILAIVLALTQRGTVELTVAEPENTQQVTETESGTYTFDPASSTIQWAGSKTLVDGYTDRGTINLDQGTLELNEGELVGGSVVVDMQSIAVVETGRGDGNDRLQGHLSSDDFFAVEQFPTARFVITEVTPTDEPGSYMVTGDMSIKETTTMVEAPLQLQKTDTAYLVVGDITIDRTRFNVRFGSDKFFDNLGDNVIDDEFTLRLSLQAPLDK